MQIMNWEMFDATEVANRDRFVPSVAPIHEVDSKLDSRSADVSMHEGNVHEILQGIKPESTLSHKSSVPDNTGRSHFAQVQVCAPLLRRTPSAIS